MKPVRDVVAAIGRTPLIKLRAASEATGCTILGKAEFMNPGGSVKDRAALAMISDAVARGALRPGGIVVEGTAGNTGIGIAMVASALGYRAVIVIPDTQAQEKKDMLRLAGAELIEVPAVPYSNPNNYVRYSGRLAEALAKTEPNGAVWANQFDNVANRRGHYETTGPEIYDDLNGEVHGFVAAVGSGGTLAGVGMALKERNASIKIALADPLGAALYSFYTSGELKSSGSSITEGIGQGRITANLEGAPVDFAYQIPDEEALPIVFDLVVQEGLLLGGSSGINIAGAMRLARELGPGHTIVTILCDSGARYASKLFNPAFLRSKNSARSGLARGQGRRAPGVRVNDADPVSRGRVSGRDGSRRALRRTARNCARSHGLLRARRGTKRRPRLPVARGWDSDPDRQHDLRFRPRHDSACSSRRGRPARSGRGRHRPHRLGSALQAHARSYRAAPAFGRRALSGDGRIGRRRRGAARFRFRARPCSTRRTSKAGSTR